MKKICAANAAPKLHKALDSNTVSDEYAKRRYQLATAVLYSDAVDKKAAVKLCEQALETDDGDHKKLALTFKNELI